MRNEIAISKCAGHHFGAWAVDEAWFSRAVSAVREGIWKPVGQTVDPDDENESTPSYQTVGSIAIISIAGPMMKARSKFGGTSTVDVRSQLRQARADQSIAGVLIRMDSPGGTVPGTDALAMEIAATDQVKPVHVHIEDLGASAGYYAASQASRITAEKTSLVGSLGVMMVLNDQSKRYETAGVKTFVISTGPMKGAGTEGAPISDEQLKYFQGIVDSANAHFKSAVMSGRNFTQIEADALFDGRVHDAQQAKQLGLIDDVSTLDDAMAAITKETSMNKEAFDTYAAEHPQAVAGFISKGKRDAVAEFVAIRDAAGPENLTLAVNAFVGGQSADAVKTAAAAANGARAEAQIIADAIAKQHSEALATKQAEIDRLKALADAGGRAAVAISPQADGGKPEPSDDPESQAEAEWDSNKDECQKAFHSEKVYVAFRKAELSGSIKRRGSR